MVREQPPQVGGIRQGALEVAGDRAVQLPSRAARERPVGDVSDQHVLEREFDVSLDLALRVTEDQPAGLERLERLVRLQVSHPVQDAAPEVMPDHRCVEQRGARVRREGVDAPGDGGPDGRRQLVARDRVRHGGAQFLEEQRVPLGHRHDPFDRRCVRRRQQCGRHRLRVERAERLERERRLSDHPAAPGPTGLEELRSGERHHQQPSVADVDDQVVDQVEQRIVRPVHVLEDQQERLPLGEMLHQHPHREQQVDRLIGRRVQPEPEEQAQVARGIGGAAVREELVDGCGHLRAGDLDGIVLVDAGDVSHHLAGGAIGRLLLVREAPTPQGATPLPLEPLGGLASQPRLADPRRAEDRHQWGRPSSTARSQTLARTVELATPAGERRVRCGPAPRCLE